MNAGAGGSAYHATDGTAYEVFLGRWTRRLADPLLDFARFPAAGRLLDVGCGTGSLACAMAARWPARNVVGIDIAAPYVAFARSQARFANLQFDLVDAIRLPYADASFGGAAAQLVLNFVPNPIEVLHEIQRVTVPGSPVVAAVWDFRGGLVYQRIFWDTAAGFDPGAAVARDKLFSGTLALPDGLPRLVRIRGARPSGANVHHDSHGLRKFRRLLEAAVRRPRAGRDLPSEPRAGPACANRGSGRLGLPLGRAGWPAFACGNGVGGAGRSEMKAAGKRADFQPHLARCAHWCSDKVRKMTAFPSATRASIRAITTLSGYSRWGQNSCSPSTL